MFSRVDVEGRQRNSIPGSRSLIVTQVPFSCCSCFVRMLETMCALALNGADHLKRQRLLSTHESQHRTLMVSTLFSTSTGSSVGLHRPTLIAAGRLASTLR